MATAAIPREIVIKSSKMSNSIGKLHSFAKDAVILYVVERSGLFDRVLRFMWVIWVFLIMGYYC